MWRLTSQVSGLRDIFDDSEDDVPPELEPLLKQTFLSSKSNSEAILFPNALIAIDNTVLEFPLQQSKGVLLDVYRYRVDPLFKILHWPTVVNMIHSAKDDPISPPVRALESAIYFTALCTMTDGEVETMLCGSESALLHQHRIATEVLIARKNLLQSPCLIALQAFVIYIVSQ